MWTATLEEKQIDGDQVKAIVLFTDGASRKFTELFNVYNTDQLQQIVAAKIENLNKLDASPIELGPISTTQTDISPVDQATADKIQFKNDYLSWVQVKKAIDNGILKGDETEVIALKTKVQTNYKPEYLTIL